jgi:hypothetical protein
MKKHTAVGLSVLALLLVVLSPAGVGTIGKAENGSPASNADDHETITATLGGERSTWRLVWRIDEPEVTERITEYPQIRFKPGDKVAISAGGCVQTGGHGKTWKRYFNPQGPNSNRLYHGLIWIPGVIGAANFRTQPDPLRIMDVNQSFTVPSGKNIDTYLRLGYEDDDYSDNGYWGHDDGTGDQCKGVGNAFVTVTIVRSMPVGTEMKDGKLYLEPHYVLKTNQDGTARVWSGNSYEAGGFVGYCNSDTSPYGKVVERFGRVISCDCPKGDTCIPAP